MKVRRFVAVGMLLLAVVTGLQAYVEMDWGRLMAKAAIPHYPSISAEELAASTLTREELAKSILAGQESDKLLAAAFLESNQHDNRILCKLLIALGLFAAFLFVVLWRFPDSPAKSPDQPH